MEILNEGLEHVARYRDKIDATAPAYLIVFDRRSEAKEKSWDERLTWEIVNGITVTGC